MTQNASPTGRALIFGRFRLIVTQRLLMKGDSPVRIGSRALEILFALLERPGEVLSKSELMARVWPKMIVEEGTLRVHIASLRKILAAGDPGMRYIENVTGHGYRFVAPVVVSEAVEGAGASADDGELCVWSPALHRIFGRTLAVATLATMMRDRHFVTVVGAGGIGKTTVALATAERLQNLYEHGMRCVDLASVADPRRVASALASMLELPVYAEEPLPNVADYLASRQMLIVLDNCEHVVEAVAVMAETIMRRSAGVHLMATSREPLRAEGEWLYRLAPLALPIRTDLSASEALTYPAVQLFVERASASTGRFELIDQDVAAVIEMCRKLDGLPLAIELAAASVDRFGLNGLVARLDDRLQLLKNGRRTALPRHRTLRATLDWSYEILGDEERRLLRRLAVFAGSFDAAAAVFIVALMDLDERTVPDLLADLAGKSLLAANVSGEDVHYRLLDTTREYALEKLRAAGEDGVVRRRHAELCARWVWTEPDDRRAWRTPERSIDDVRAALDWCFSTEGDACLGVRLLAHSSSLWFRLSFLEEYGRRVDRALELLEAKPEHDVGVEMELNMILGEVVLYTEGPGQRVSRAFLRAYEIAERIHEPMAARLCLWGMYSARVRGGDYAAALDYATRWGRIPEPVPQAMANRGERMLAFACHLIGDFEQAARHARIVLAGSSEVAERTVPGTFHFDDRVAALGSLALTLWIQGFPEQALRAAREGIDRAKALDHGLSICYALACAGTVHVWVGDSEAASRIAAELIALATRHVLGHWVHWAHCLEWGIAAGKGSARDVLAQARASSFDSFLHVETLATFDEAFADAKAIERAEHGIAGWCAAELLRVKALATAETSSRARESALRAALELARRQGALAWELRIARSLAQSLVARDCKSEAHRLLESVLARFTEGRGSRDLIAAQSLMDGLWASQSVGKRAG